jgi:hypothetical protein
MVLQLENVISEGGTEAGYEEQATAYTNMMNAANAGAKGESVAQTGDFIAAGISAIAAITPA